LLRQRGEVGVNFRPGRADREIRRAAYPKGEAYRAAGSNQQLLGAVKRHFEVHVDFFVRRIEHNVLLS
jgi:hypothetical protein